MCALLSMSTVMSSEQFLAMRRRQETNSACSDTDDYDGEDTPRSPLPPKLPSRMGYWAAGHFAKGGKVPRTSTKAPRAVAKNIGCFSKSAHRRLAMRAGCRRLAASCHDESQLIVKTFLTNLLRDALKYTEHGRRKTVVAADIVHALSRQGIRLYGCTK